MLCRVLLRGGWRLGNAQTERTSTFFLSFSYFPHALTGSTPTQNISPFLAHFGLRLLASTAFCSEEFSGLYSECLSPVSLLPLSSSQPSLTPSTSISIYCEDPDTAHSAVSLSSALEALPSNAPARFRQLLRLFPLSVSYPGTRAVNLRRRGKRRRRRRSRRKALGQRSREGNKERRRRKGKRRKTQSLFVGKRDGTSGATGQRSRSGSHGGRVRSDVVAV
jgi:hypothetical protein